MSRPSETSTRGWQKKTVKSLCLYNHHPFVSDNVQIHWSSRTNLTPSFRRRQILSFAFIIINNSIIQISHK